MKKAKTKRFLIWFFVLILLFSVIGPAGVRSVWAEEPGLEQESLPEDDRAEIEDSEAIIETEDTVSMEASFESEEPAEETVPGPEAEEPSEETVPEPETEEPSVNSFSEEPIEEKTEAPADLWLAISDLEFAASSATPEAFSALLPQIEQLVLSYAGYEPDSLYYEDGVLFWRSDGVLNGYSPETRAAMHGTVTSDIALLQEESAYAPEEIGSDLKPAFAAGPDPSAKNICVFLPYSGTTMDFFSQYENIGATLADCTGGELLCYYGTEATVDKLAAALQSCAVVIIASHGSAPGGYFGITTNAGLTSDDLNGGHGWDAGPSYIKVGGSTVLDFHLWNIDGTVVANHMGGTAPSNLIITPSCMGMKTDKLCSPLLNKGVAAVFGYSETVTVTGSTAFDTAFANALCEGYTVGEAFKMMKSAVGSDWDPAFSGITLEQAVKIEAAFPVVASDEDAYPAGHVNAVQEVTSPWKLPIRDDKPEKYVLTKDVTINNYLIATIRDSIKSVSISSGEIPEGTSYYAAGNTLLLQGTPNKKGYTLATFTITTVNDETINKPIGFVTTDYSTVTINNSFIFTAPDLGEWRFSPYLTAAQAYEGILYHDASDETFTVVPQSSSLLISLEYGTEDAKNGYIRSAKSPFKTSYLATAPGMYNVTLDFITLAGDVYRHVVDITVNPANTYTPAPVDFYLQQYQPTAHLIYTEEWDSESSQYKRWGTSAVESIEIQSGALPNGLYFGNSSLKPFGLYGTPEESGDFIVKARVSTYNDFYNYTFNIHVSPAYLVTFDLNGGTGDMTDSSISPDELPYKLPPCFAMKEGHTFVSWDAGKPGEYINLTGNIVLKALWEEIEYTLDFETNEGSPVPAQQVKYGHAPVKPADPSKTGYDFDGWYEDSSLTTPFDFGAPISAAKTAYAKWVKVEYTVVSGADTSWTSGSTEPVVITVKRNVADETCFGHFTAVDIDGSVLTKGTDYTAVSGSTVITLNPSALQKLSVGSHIITISFDDGFVQTKVNIQEAPKKPEEPKNNPQGSGNGSQGTGSGSQGAKSVSSPKTGDEQFMFIWIVLLGLSFTFLAYGSTRKNRNRL